MEITLEKIELVKDRTGVSYKDAKDALEKADGSVVDAIISIEEDIDQEGKKNVSDSGAAIMDSIKEIIKKGNVSKIVVRNNDGDVIVKVPVNVGIVGAFIAPLGLVAAGIASIGFKCVVEIVKIDGTIIEVSDKASEATMKAKEKSSEVYGRVVANETVGKVKVKAEDTFERTSEAVKNRMKKDTADDFAKDFDIDEGKTESDGEEY